MGADSHSKPRAIFRHARTVASLTLLSRLLGLTRDVVVARVFGAGPIWSAFALAFLAPNLFRRLFGEGALAAALIPEYARVRRDAPEEAAAFAGAVIAVTSVALWILTGVLELALFALLTVVEWNDSATLALRLLMIMLPFMPLVCATATLGSLLQSHDRFAPTAAAPIILNLFMIAACLVWGVALEATLDQTAAALGASVVGAGVVQLAWAALALRPFVRIRARFRSAVASVRSRMRALLRQLLPVLVGLGVLQLNQLLDGVLASWPVLFGSTLTLPAIGTIDVPVDTASNSVLFYAQRLHQFPLGVVGIALATAIFPALARAAEDMEDFAATLSRGLRVCLFIGIPASVGLILVRDPLTRAVYEGGRFDASDSARVIRALLGYAPALWASMLTHVLTRSLYALDDVRTPLRVALRVVGINFTLNLILIWPLREAGLAWSTTIAAIVQTAVLWRMVRRRVGQPAWSGVGRSALWSLSASALMALVVSGLAMVLRESSLALAHLTELALLTGAGALSYAALAAVMKRPELAWTLSRDREAPRTSARG